MTRDDGWGIVDPLQKASLSDEGAPGYDAVTVVNEDGSNHLLIARRDRLNDDTASYYGDCPDVRHEQLGPLPLDVINRIAIVQRAQRRPESHS